MSRSIPSSRGARQGSQQSQRPVWSGGLQVDVRALPARKLRRSHAVFHREQGTQRRPAHQRPEAGADAKRVRPVSRSRATSAWPATPRKKSTSSWASPGFRPNCAKTAARLEAAADGRLPNLIELARNSRRSAHAHHRDRRKGDAPRDGGSGARRSGTNTSPSPIIRKRSPWPTVSTSGASVAFAQAGSRSQS